MSTFEADGFVHLPLDATVHRWAQAAYRTALNVAETPGDLRHGKTWRVGVDELPNAPDGSMDGVPLAGPWKPYVDAPKTWHPAQLSIVYPGYPQKDPDETDANHRFRKVRDAGHVDGLLPEGPAKRRYLREPHAFILGLPLNTASSSPLVVWPGSQLIMRRAFADALQDRDPAGWAAVDLTDTYQAARREVFATCTRLEVPARPGEATLVHRHLVHGVAPWNDETEPVEGRMIAYFRPHLRNIADWL